MTIQKLRNKLRILTDKVGINQHELVTLLLLFNFSKSIISDLTGFSVSNILTIQNKHIVIKGATMQKYNFLLITIHRFYGKQKFKSDLD